jgi:hypothetical protein
MRLEELERRLRAHLDALGPAPRAELPHVPLPDFDQESLPWHLTALPRTGREGGERPGVGIRTRVDTRFR